MRFQDCTRVYTHAGKTAHLLAPSKSPNDGYPAALCGHAPLWGAAWYGTGSQRELDRANKLPLCTRCSKSIWSKMIQVEEAGHER